MDEYQSGKKSLELSCYVAGAGAFGVFVRWLQRQLAFDELGLAERSAFHFLVAGFILASVIVFLRFVKRFEKEHRYLPEDFGEAFTSKEHILYQIIRIVAGVLLCAGAVLLMRESGKDRNATDYQILSVLILVSGIAFPVWLGAADWEKRPPAWVLCLLSFLPMLAMAAWVVICYKLNIINSVIWDYVIELGTIAVAMFAFFRLGGFVFGKPDWKRCLFLCMLAAMLCIMVLADERYLGMQLIFLALAIALLLCGWIMVKNLKKGEAPPPPKKNTGGFETL